MKINKDIRSTDDKVNAYIVSLESYFESLEASNIMRLIKECDEASGVIADDVRLLRTENDDEKLDSELKMLGSKKNKRFEAFLALVKTVKDLKGISDMMNEIRLGKEEKAQLRGKSKKQEEVEPVKRVNIQDMVTKK